MVPVCALPGGSAKEHTSQRTPLDVRDQVLKIFTDSAAVAQVMVLVEQRIEEGALASRRFAILGTFAQSQREQSLEGLSNGCLRSANIQPLHLQLRLPGPHSIGGNPAARRQHDRASLLQLEQQSASRHVLEQASAIAPVPLEG